MIQDPIELCLSLDPRHVVSHALLRRVPRGPFQRLQLPDIRDDVPRIPEPVLAANLGGHLRGGDLSHDLREFQHSIGAPAANVEHLPNAAETPHAGWTSDRMSGK